MPDPAQPTATTEAPTEPARIIDDEILESLRSDLGLTLQPEPPLPTIKAATETAPAPAAPAAPATTTAPGIRVGVRKQPEQLTREGVRQVVQEVVDQAATKPAAPAKPAATEPAFTKEQSRDLEVAQFAAEHYPDQFPKDFTQKLKTFWSKAAEFAAQRKAVLGHEPTADDEEMVRFIEANKPQWTVPKEEVMSELVTHSRNELKKVQDTVGDLSKRVEETAGQAKLVAIQPKINQFATELQESMKSDDPFEANVYQTAVDYGTELATTLYSLAEGVVKPDLKKDEHRDLFEIMTKETNRIMTSAEAKRGDRNFVSPAEYAKLQRETKDLSKVWTLSPKEITAAIKRELSERAKGAISHEMERLSKLGFTRQKGSQVSNPAQTQQQEPAPITAPLQGRGLAPGATEQLETESMLTPGMELAKDLGIA